MKILGGAAALVVFVSTYILILLAITLSGTPTCGLEEHTHTDSCYTEEQILICGQEESTGHSHTAECYGEDGNLICAIPEHVHSESCCPEEDATETVKKYVVTGKGLITSTKSSASVIKITAGTFKLNSGMIAGCTTHHQDRQNKSG